MIEYTVKVYDNGTKYWYLNGELHREDGPATEYPDGTKYWYLNGENLSEAEYQKRMNPVKEYTVAEISAILGYEVKIVR
jgi:hypothetical protein